MPYPENKAKTNRWERHVICKRNTMHLQDNAPPRKPMVEISTSFGNTRPHCCVAMVTLTWQPNQSNFNSSSYIDHGNLWQHGRLYTSWRGPESQMVCWSKKQPTSGTISFVQSCIQARVQRSQGGKSNDAFPRFADLLTVWQIFSKLEVKISQNIKYMCATNEQLQIWSYKKTPNLG